MSKCLTREICREYRSRMNELPELGLQDIGPRRELRIELQERCGLSELEALNICNGYHWDVYIATAERRYEQQMLKEAM